MATMDFLRRLGQDLDQLWWDCSPYHVQFYEPTRMQPTKHTKEIINYPKKNMAIGLQHLCRSLSEEWIRPSEVGLHIIEILLKDGLDPNYRIHKMYFWPHDRFVPLLHWAMLGMKNNRATRFSKASGRESQRSIARSVYTKDLEPWCIVRTLIRYGVNIHWLDPSSFDQASFW